VIEVAATTYVAPPPQESGLPAGAPITNVASAVKKWASDLPRQWREEICHDNEWYEARFAWSYHPGFRVLRMQWRFWGLRYKGGARDDDGELTSESDVNEVGWLLGRQPGESEPEPPPTAIIDETTLRVQAESFLAICRLFPHHSDLEYPPARRRKEPRLTVRWPRRKPSRNAVTAVGVIALVMGVMFTWGCTAYFRDRTRFTAALNPVSGGSVGASGVCVDGAPLVRVGFLSTLPPPVRVMRDDVYIGDMRLKSHAGGMYEYQFDDPAVLPRRTYAYVLEKRMWLTGEPLRSPTVGAPVPPCKAGNHDPTAGVLTVTPAVARVGDAVLFRVEAGDPDGDPLTYVWTFGDQRAPRSGRSHDEACVYHAAGLYNVLVNVRDPYNGLVTRSRVVAVAAPHPHNHPPTIAMLLAPREQRMASGSSIIVDAIARDADGDHLFYAWTFDGEPTPNGYAHRWESFGVPPGPHQIAVTVYDVTMARSNTATLDVTGADGAPAPLEGHGVDITIAPRGPLAAGTPISFFLPAGITGIGGPTRDVLWDFGDGSPLARGYQPVHAYRQDGEYEVSALVAQGGRSGVLGGVVVIGTPPHAEPVDAPLCTVAPAEGTRDTVFAITAHPPAEAVVACPSGGQYRFTLSDPLHHRMWHSGWLNTNVYRGRVPALGPWEVTYEMRCGNGGRTVGVYAADCVAMAR